MHNYNTQLGSDSAVRSHSQGDSGHAVSAAPSLVIARHDFGGNMFERIARLWCKRAHTRPMWPIHGRYICAQCLRQHPVAWDPPIAGTSHLMGAQSRRLILIRQPDTPR
jgi:hypothetical protein